MMLLLFTGGGTVLESPVLPLAEGDSLTLRCLVKAGVANGSKVEFYKDGSLLKTQTVNIMIIPNISKSDEGMYKCKGPTHSESPSSWVAVRSETKLFYNVFSSLFSPPWV